MALSQGVKDTVDAMSNVDKALLTLYTSGHDDNQKAIDLGKAFVAAYWPGLVDEELTNNELALAILKATNNNWVEIYKAYKVAEAEAIRLQLLEDATAYMEEEYSLEDMPEPEEEP